MDLSLQPLRLHPDGSVVPDANAPAANVVTGGAEGRTVRSEAVHAALEEERKAKATAKEASAEGEDANGAAAAEEGAGTVQSPGGSKASRMSKDVAGGRFQQLERQPEVMTAGKLHDYQLEGVNWLRDSWWSNRNVILADEMGLGKTIQSAAYCQAVALEAPLAPFKPFLVVGPLSTLGNWERELRLWCPDMNVISLQGVGAARELFRAHEVWGPLPAGAPGGTGARGRKVKFHALLTSYEVVGMEQSLLKQIHCAV